MTEIAEFIKSVTRPFCLIIMILCISAMAYEGKEVPVWLYGTLIPMLVWWGVDRSLKHLSDRRVK